jgi:RNA polymerase sigma-70 factor (ECF subfamily)
MDVVAAQTLTDAEVVDRVRRGDTPLFEVLMRRHNQRVYRVARAIVKDETEAEDIMQQAYVNAFTHLHQFEERAQFSTWLTRIAVHEALGRRRRTRTTEPIGDAEEEPMERHIASGPDPERQAYAGELRGLIESAVDALPDTYRMVFMLRDVEGLSTAETADGLDIGQEAVKTRLHRARALLRRHLFERAGAASAQAFAFHLSRCDRVVAGVFSRIQSR